MEIGHGLWEGETGIRNSRGLGRVTPGLEGRSRDGANARRRNDSRRMGTLRGLLEQQSRMGSILQRTALVVAHDAVNKTILCHLLGLAPKGHLGR